VLFMLLVTAPATAQELVERTLAIVGGSAITLSDVRTAMALGVVDTREEAVAIEALVQRMLILREVDRYAPPEPAPEVLDARLAQLHERVGASEVAAILSAGGFTDARLRAWLRDDLRIAAYLDQRFAADGPEQRQSLVEDWVADLRRRTPVVELWKR
jgi:hypothetical protein